MIRSSEPKLSKNAGLILLMLPRFLPGSLLSPLTIGAITDRFISAGYLRGRMVVIVWTLRDDARHIISMRYCHAKEKKLWREKN
jgi:hypothetical protein